MCSLQVFLNCHKREEQSWGQQEGFNGCIQQKIMFSCWWQIACDLWFKCFLAYSLQMFCEINSVLECKWHRSEGLKESKKFFFFLYSIQNVVLYLPKNLQNNPPNTKDGENA